MIKYGIIGAGWRAEFYIKIGLLYPEIFAVSGIYIRNIEKRNAFSRKYPVKIFDNLEDLLKTDFHFIVSCVNKDSIDETAQMLADKSIAVLTETPVTNGNLKGKIQVAEQFHLMPRNQAYKKIIDSGILGEIQQVQLSCCHDYHAVSLIRYFLDVKNKMPTISTVTLPDRVIKYNGRGGKCEPAEINAQQKIAVLNYGDKSAVYDFGREQYFSDIRASRIVIRGTKGEIINDTCTYLDGDTPLKFNLIRNYCGTNENLDGMYLDSITGNGRVLYKNPFPTVRFSDEETAIATCLIKMKEYLETGKSFYTIKDAALDFKTALNL